MANVTANVSVTSVSATLGDPIEVTITPTFTNVQVSPGAVSNADIRGALSNVSPILYDEANGIFSFDSAASFAGKTTDDLAEGTNNKYWSTAGNPVTTTYLTEGTNLYYTEGRANSAIDARIPDFIDSNLITLKYWKETVQDLGLVSGNVGISGANGTIVKMTAVADITGFNFYSGWGNGSTIQMIITQDGVGGHALDTSSGFSTWQFANNYTGLAQTATKSSVLTVTHYDGVNYASIVELDTPSPLENSALANSSLTVNGTTISLGGSGDISNFGSLTTDNLSEGSTNLYYADSLVNTFLTTTGVTGNLTVSGNLDVAGNLNYENVVDLYVQDQKITLNANATTDATVEIIANRPQTTSTVIRWNETTEKWEFTNDGSTYYAIPASTDDLAEGSSNLYFANSLARAAISVTENPASGNGGLIYSAGTGVFTFTPADVPTSTDDLPEGTTNKYFSNTLARAAFTASGDLSYDQANGIFSVTTYKSTDFDTDFAAKTTDDLTEGTTNKYWSTAGNAVSTTYLVEGTNLYYTTDRANSAIEAHTGSIANLTGNVVTTGNITGGYIIAGNDAGGDGIFIGDINGAIQAEVYNASGGTLTKGAIVALNGNNHGSTPDVVLAESSNASLMPGFGVVKNNIAPTATGEVIISGKMNFAGHGFTVGAQLYVNGVGQFTETQPDGEGNLVQKIAKVVNSSTIYVAGAQRTNATPNLDNGNIFVGDSNDRAVTADLDNFTYPITSSANIKTDGASLQSTGGIHGKADGSGLIGFTSYDSNILSGDTLHMVMTDASFGQSILGGTYRVDLRTNKNDSEVRLVPDGTMVDGQFKLVNMDLAFSGANASINNVGSLRNTTSTVFEQPFINTYSPVATIDGDGFVFRSSGKYTTNLLSYSGTDPLVAYKINGNIVAGSNEIAITAVNRYYDDAASAVSDLLPGMVYAEGTAFGARPKGFPVYAYVQSVDSANSKIIMSETALANIDFTDSTLWSGMIDTTRQQVVQIRSDYDNSGGSNTSVHFGLPMNSEAYGYPKTGMVANHFDVFAAGSSSDYTWDANVANFMVGRTTFTAEGTAPKYINGLVVGERTSLTNRGINDDFESFGVNVLWDGVSLAGDADKIPQYFIKGYTQNSGAQTFPSSNGPRLFFTSAKGQATDYDFDQYPRENQELGRITWWGTSGTSLTHSSTNPPAYISVQAHDDWAEGSQVGGNTDVYMASTGDKTTRAQTYLAFKHGKLILGSGSNADDGQKEIEFAPAQVQAVNTPQSVYNGRYKSWANVNYANVSASSGASFVVSHGGSAGAGTVGDQQLVLKRNDNSSVADYYFKSFINSGLFVGAWNGQVGCTLDPSVGSSLNGATVTFSGAGTITDSSTGNESAMEGGTYTLYYIFNGGTYVFYRIFSGASPVTYSSLGGSTPPEGLVNQTTSYARQTISSGVTDFEYKFVMPEQAETLQLQSNASTIVEYSSNRVNIQDDVFLNLPSASNTTILGYTGMSNGDMVYNSTDATVAVYAGGVWQNLQFSGNVA